MDLLPSLCRSVQALEIGVYIFGFVFIYSIVLLNVIRVNILKYNSQKLRHSFVSDDLILLGLYLCRF